MKTHRKTRREALRTIVATVAAAAGLSALEVEALLAQVKKPADLTKLAGIKPTDDSVKALKVLLAPKAQAAQVFQSEFGKAPALQPSLDAKTRKPTCAAYLGSGACMELGCNLVVCNGLSLGPQGRPEREFQQQQAVGGRTQGASTDCERGFNRTDSCGLYVPPTGGMLGDPKVHWLREKHADPYIQGLMRELEVTTPEELEKELVQILAQRRAGM